MRLNSSHSLHTHRTALWCNEFGPNVTKCNLSLVANLLIYIDIYYYYYYVVGV